MDEKKPSEKPSIRKDALRNRNLIIEAAKDCFAANGDSVTLDDIVNKAGVGVGTLYRHFKTRDALIEAVYLLEHEKLVLKAKEFEHQMPAVDALQQWLLAFIDMLATKRAMKESLNLLFSAKPEVHSASRNMMEPTLRRLLENAAASGEVKVDIEPLDLLRALVGIAFAGSEPDWHENSRKFVALLIAGMRVNPPGN